MLPKTNIFGKTSYSEFYKYSDIRSNLLEWVNFQETCNFLIVNEEKTSLVHMLQERGHRITTISEEMVLDGLTGEYDVIFQIGSLKCGGEQPEKVYRQYLSSYRTHLTEKGLLILAVPNRLGLRYFAGCMDEDTGVYFDGPEGYPQIKEEQRQALSRKEYERAFGQTGFSEVRFYYPYPDYKFPMSIYSDEWLPQTGELNSNIRNFDRDRYVLFDETKVYDSLVGEGLFPEFSNSFLIFGYKKLNGTKNRVIYTKYSNEREKCFQIRTDIVEKPDGERYVEKTPLCRQAVRHVEQMQEFYQVLEEENKSKSISFCPTKIEHGAAVSPFVSGTSLQSVLQNLIQEKKFKEAEGVLKGAISGIREYLENRVADRTAVTDLDLIFPNIFVENNHWTIIDYEWSFDTDIPAEFVLYRALFRASMELPECELTQLSTLLEMADISEKAAQKYRDWENTFQKYITGNQIPARDMVELLGNQVIPFWANKTQLEREAEELMAGKHRNVLDICFYIDRQENKYGKAVCSGWACAALREHQFIPVYIQILDQTGHQIEGEIHRSLRTDVKSAIQAKDKEREIWGFDVKWTAKSDETYRIRFFAGNMERIIELELTGADG